jgi:hypothetical protein
MKNLRGFDDFMNESTVNNPNLVDEYKIAKAVMLQILEGADHGVTIKSTKFDADKVIETAIDKAIDQDDRYASPQFSVDHTVKMGGNKSYEITLEFITEYYIKFVKSSDDNVVTPAQDSHEVEPEGTLFETIYVDGTELDMDDEMKAIAKVFKDRKIVITDESSYQQLLKKK